MKVLFATCDSLPAGDGDDDALVGALADVGVHAAWTPWGTPAQADLVVLRSTWDYPERLPEFLAWCDTEPALVNPAPVVRWNTDKTYLAELARHGVPVVPTAVAGPGFTTNSPSGQSLGVPALVQPYQSHVDSVGETAVVFLGGQYSHAFTKCAMLTPDAEYDESGLYVVERLSGAAPSPAQRRVAEDVVDAAAELIGLRRDDLLYARVDLIPGADGAPLLLELELVEPSLGFRQTDATAPLRFASAVRAALARR
jgi:hypothetical protein